MNHTARLAHAAPLIAPHGHGVDLPQWIAQDAATRPRAIRAEHWSFMAAVAAMGTTQADGSIVGAYGGDHLADAAGCSMRSLWRRLSRLEGLGYVVCVCRGGMATGRNLANVYGIPGSRGGLDHVKATRRRQRMAPGLDGVRRPQVIRRGDRPTLWHDPDTAPEHHEPDTGGEKCHDGRVTFGEKCHDGRVTFGEKCHTLVSGTSGKYQSGISRRGRSTGPGAGGQAGEPRITDVKRVDLTDTGRLLGLLDQAVWRGLTGTSDADRLGFVAKAVYALRAAKDKRGPGPLFVHLVKSPLFDTVSHDDEDTAVARIKAHLYGQDGKRAQIIPDSITGPSDSGPADDLSPDVRLAAATIRVARSSGSHADPYHLLRGQPQGTVWTRGRWDRAVAQIGGGP